MFESDVDLITPAGFDKIRDHGFWRRLRQQSPVTWHPPRDGIPGFWVLTRHADIAAAYRDTGRFSSARGNMLTTLTTGGDPASGRMLVVSDPPWHSALRRSMQPAFAARAMGRIAHSIRSVAKTLIAGAVERGEIDFVSDVAARVPLAAICDLLEVPVTDRARMLELTSLALGEDGSPEQAIRAREARSDIMEYYSSLIASRRDGVGEDVLSLLGSALVGGRRLTDSEAFLNAYNLIIGGNETTRLSAAGGVLALADHPEQWTLLRESEEVIQTAAEEILRWTSPVAHIARIVSTDVSLGGVDMSAGDIVTLWQISANYDETVFPEPERFDVCRTPNKHISFGVGPHHCIGAALAKVELHAVLAELRAQVRNIRITGPVEYLRSNTLLGVRRMPVALESV
ncbi:cytochrome P450 [Streptomyces griseoruber]|uniref:cytochrome P450 n=1 Tax=Streptomyces griseoruber TaxID=1943 RepID=UPI0037A22334